MKKERIKNGSHLTSFTHGGRTFNQAQCLLIYYKYCDDFGLTPDKSIETANARAIFDECMRIYGEYGVS